MRPVPVFVLMIACNGAAEPSAERQACEQACSCMSNDPTELDWCVEELCMPESDRDRICPPAQPMVIVSYEPADGATGVSRESPIRFRFDRWTRPVQGSPSFVLLGEGGEVAGELSHYGSEGRTYLHNDWWFVPEVPLAPSSTYEAVVETGWETELPFDNYVLDEPFSWTFTTEGLPGPDLVDVTPAGGSTGVPLDVVPTATYESFLDPDSITEDSVFLATAGGRRVAGRRELSSFRVSFTPDQPLESSTDYVFFVTDEVTGGGNPVAESVRAEFRTAGFLSPTGMSPADGATKVSVDAELKLTFNVAIDPATVRADSIRPEASRLFLDRSNAIVGGTTTVSGNTLSFTPTQGSWQEYDTTYAIELDDGLRGVNGEVLDYRDGDLEFTTVFLDEDRNYTFHTFADGRSARLGVNTGGVNQYAQRFSHTGGEGSSRWAVIPEGDRFRLWNLAYGSSQILAGRDGTGPADLERLDASATWPNTVWYFDSYGGHPDFVQRFGESPSLYYMKTNQWADRALRFSYDSSRGYTKAWLDRPTGNINQLWWISRYER